MLLIIVLYHAFYNFNINAWRLHLQPGTFVSLIHINVKKLFFQFLYTIIYNFHLLLSIRRDTRFFTARKFSRAH